MKDIIVNITRETGFVDKTIGVLGREMENLQAKLIFKFTDEFVDGQARLEYKICNTKNYVMLNKNDNTYEIPVKDVMLIKGQVNMQLVVTEGTDTQEIPVFKSKIFYFTINESINAVTEAPEGYELWIERANAILNQMDTIDIDIETTERGSEVVITRKDGEEKRAVVSGGGGTYDHSELTNLDYENSGHTGFQAEIEDLDDIREGAELGSTAVQDNNYVHTDNNFTTEEKNKLEELENYDDTEVRQEIETKVDKETGKGLSTNDFTTTEKNKLAGLENYDDTEVKADITANTNAISSEATARQTADNNLQSQIDAITSASDVVDVVGTYAELQAYDTTLLKDNDIIKVLVDETRQNAITYYRWNDTTETFSFVGSQGPFYTKGESDNRFVQKETGKGLSEENYTALEKTKLAGIEANAEVNDIDTIKIKGTTQTITDKIVDLDVPTTDDLDDTINWNTASTSVDGENLTVDALRYKTKKNKVNGKYEQVTTTGKNKFDGIFEIGSINIETGEEVFISTNIRTKNYIPIEPNTQYTVSGIAKTRWGIYFDNNKNYLGYVALGTQIDKNTFTSISNAYYIRWYHVNNTDVSSLEQLELGSTATSYEPYTRADNQVHLQTFHKK